MRTTLLIPARNEVKGMQAILPRIQRHWVDEILVVDGGSTDGSPEYAEGCGFKVLRQKSKGLIGAYREGLEAATGDIIIPFSPDGNSVPERIPDLVAKMREGYDMVIVSRYLDGAKSRDDTFLTALGNRIFTKLINLLFGAGYTDTLVMFRAWRKDLVREFLVDPTIAGFEPQLCIECAKRKRRIAEIPGDEPPRIGGATKARRLKAAWAILRLIGQEFFTAVSS